jgi:hypothetical protein
MVKEAEKQKKVNVMSPIWSLLLIIGLFAVSYAVSSVLFQTVPQLKGPVNGMGVIRIPIPGTVAPLSPTDPPNTKPGQIVIAIPITVLLFSGGIWLAFLAFAYFLVTMLAGKDPEDSAKMPLPPRKREKNTFRK